MPSYKGATKAFTLVELLLTISIIGILASIAIVASSDAIERANLGKILVWSNSVYHLLGKDIRSRYSFNEGQTGTCPGSKDICDSSSNNHCTIYGSATWVKSNVPGGEKAINLPGSSYIDCSSDSNSSDYPALTIEFWIKPTALVAGSSWVKKNGAWDIATSDTNGSMRFIVINGGNYEVDAVPGTIKTNQWSHILATYDPSLPSNNMKIYLNSRIVAEARQTIGILTLPSAPLVIGSNTNGIIEELRIYAQTMPTASVKKSYMAGLQNLYAKGEISKEDYDDRRSAASETKK